MKMWTTLSTTDEVMRWKRGELHGTDWLREDGFFIFFFLDKSNIKILSCT